MRAPVSLMVALAVFSACGGGDDDASPAADAPTTTTTIALATRLCDAPGPVEAGSVANPELIELSGLDTSADGTLWAHNDSGDRARLFAIGPDGADLRTLEITGAAAFDWEDMTATADALYVGDIGDNLKQRENVVVYRVAEPLDDDPSVQAFEITYPDGAHDAEALMADEATGRLVIVTKETSGTSSVYSLPLDTSGTLEFDTTVDLGVGELVTAGDMTASGDVVALRTYGAVFVWARRPGESLADAFAREPCEAATAIEAQGESLAPLPDGFLTISEGIGSDGLGSPLGRTVIGK